MTVRKLKLLEAARTILADMGRVQICQAISEAIKLLAAPEQPASVDREAMGKALQEQWGSGAKWENAGRAAREEWSKMAMAVIAAYEQAKVRQPASEIVAEMRDKAPWLTDRRYESENTVCDMIDHWADALEAAEQRIAEQCNHLADYNDLTAGYEARIAELEAQVRDAAECNAAAMRRMQAAHNLELFEFRNMEAS